MPSTAPLQNAAETARADARADPMNENRPAARDDRASPRWLGASIAIFAASRLLLLVGPWPHHNDVDLYFHYARQGVELGKVPYRDFTFEYPPLAWAAISLAAQLAGDSGPLSYDAYRECFHWLMAACDLAAFVLFWSITRRRAGRWHGPLCFSYALSTAVCGYVLYERLDAGLLLLLVGWAYAWLKGIKGRRGGLAWSLGSYVLLGLGMGYKLVPAVLVPFLLLSEWRVGGLPRLAPAVATLAICIALVFAPLYPAAGADQFNFLAFHSSRGIQVESLYATVLSVASYAGASKSVARNYFFHEIVGPLAPTLKLLSRVLMVGFLCIAGLWALCQGRRYDREQAYRLACFALLATVTLANVLSPQYLIWLLPMAMLLSAELPAASTNKRWLLLAAMMGVAGLTLLDFPITYFQLIDQPDSGPHRPIVYVAEAVVGVRNAVLAALDVWLGVQVVRAARFVRTATAP